MWPTPPRLLPTQVSPSLLADVCEFSLDSALSEEPETILPLEDSVMDLDGNKPENGNEKAKMEERDAKPQYFCAG